MVLAAGSRFRALRSTVFDNIKASRRRLVFTIRLPARTRLNNNKTRVKIRRYERHWTWEGNLFLPFVAFLEGNRHPNQSVHPEWTNGSPNTIRGFRGPLINSRLRAVYYSPSVYRSPRDVPFADLPTRRREKFDFREP